MQADSRAVAADSGRRRRFGANHGRVLSIRLMALCHDPGTRAGHASRWCGLSRWFASVWAGRSTASTSQWA